MTRFILLTVLNIALVFLIRAAWIYGLRLLARRKIKGGMKDVTPPHWHFPLVPLLLTALALTALVLGVYRFTQPTESWQGYESRSGEF